MKRNLIPSDSERLMFPLHICRENGGEGVGVQTFMISFQHLFSRVQAGSSWCGPFIYLYCLYEAMVTATSMIGSMTGLMIGIAPYENSMIGSKARAPRAPNKIQKFFQGCCPQEL